MNNNSLNRVDYTARNVETSFETYKNKNHLYSCHHLSFISARIAFRIIKVEKNPLDVSETTLLKSHTMFVEESAKFLDEIERLGITPVIDESPFVTKNTILHSVPAFYDAHMVRRKPHWYKEAKVMRKIENKE